MGQVIRLPIRLSKLSRSWPIDWLGFESLRHRDRAILWTQCAHSDQWKSFLAMRYKMMFIKTWEEGVRWAYKVWGSDLR